MKNEDMDYICTIVAEELLLYVRAGSPVVISFFSVLLYLTKGRREFIKKTFKKSSRSMENATGYIGRVSSSLVINEENIFKKYSLNFIEICELFR